jgi:hypothetical protein
VSAEMVERVAEAVLYEGYLLFPYRPSSRKNQQRWTFGGVYPRGGDDPSDMQTQCLIAGGLETAVEVKARFLQVTDGDGREEAIERVVLTLARLGDLLGQVRTTPIEIAAGSDRERRWQALEGVVEVSTERFPLPSPLPRGEGVCWRLTVRVRNTATWGQASRAEALRRTFVSTHTILRAAGGVFVSLLEPPEELREAAEGCRNTGTWPVLVGEAGERHTMLSSPIILYDYPEVAPESPGNLFDTTEIDELLTLSVLALSDGEKREVRAADPRGREILERTEALSPEQILQLHGVIRELR